MTPNPCTFINLVLLTTLTDFIFVNEIMQIQNA